VDESNERNFKIVQSVADRRVATPGIPAKQSFPGKPHAGQSLGALSKGDVPGKNLNHFGSPQLVQDLAALSQEVREGLTIVAVTHRSVRALRIINKTF
jgi:hypothetical protein